MREHLTREFLESLVQSQDISKVELDELRNFFLAERGMADFAPDGYAQIDPRNLDWIVFSSARSRRPHDNYPPHANANQPQESKRCLICQGLTTRIVDVADLSEGFTFINKNLYPIFYPAQRHPSGDPSLNKAPALDQGEPVEGFHFLQWTSSFHDRDWHNMPQGDRLIAFQRLAALEKMLMAKPNVYVSVIKNHGRLVGGSLSHGHQQIAASNIMPNRIRQDQQFHQEHQQTFTDFLLRNTTNHLIIKDYGPAVLLTPYFMRRPFDMMLVLKNTARQTLHSLDDAEMVAVVDGGQDAIRLILRVMPMIGKEIAYNVTTHNGPGGGLYFEFLPYTQEMGGFEHLGLYLCQGNPYECARLSRQLLNEEIDG